MEILKYGIIVLMSLFGITIAYFVLFRKKGFRNFFLSAFLSICVLLLLNFTENLTGVGLPINYFTVIGSGVFGFPAISSLLFLNLIFI